ncbi:MAG: tRNA (adenine-N1)-methyltransferase [Candidatus Altiarchaeales archaeon HGW-Altiarchaeales-3]|nr:MAG: tRNA (adenine-N1)-methyltransferase [Candidatus Altiarchaeales archaeon HGW-Altiarchaeales-3]
MRLLIDEKERKYLVKGDSDVHISYGVIKADDLQNAKCGDIIKTHIGTRLNILEPDIIDFMEKAKRGPQTMALKDSSIIAGYTGIKSGSKVVDSGVGSGVNAMFFANIIHPEKLTCYEIREDFAKIAEQNFEKAGIENVVIKLTSIYDGIDEENLDLISLDVPEPWEAVSNAIKSLKIGGYVTSYSPSIEQSKKFYDKLIQSDGRFSIETVECLVRNWDLKVVRPFSRMLGHTGFITFARLIGRKE